MNFSDRLLKLRSNLSLNQSDMADKLGLSMNYISSLERGIKNPSDSVRNHVSLLEDAIAAGYYRAEMSAAMHESPAVYGGSSPLTRMSLVTWSDAGSCPSYHDMTRSPVDSLPAISDDASEFAVALQGSSMAPRFCEGSYLVVSPREAVTSGQYALLSFKGSAGVMFRRVEISGDTITLEPINDRYMIKEHDLSDIEWMYPVICVIDDLIG